MEPDSPPSDPVPLLAPDPLPIPPSPLFDQFEDALYACAHFLLLILIAPVLLILSPFVYIALTFIPQLRFVSHRNSAKSQQFDLAAAEYKTLFFTASDGTKLAVDVWLPSKDVVPKSLPVMVNGARYYRSAKLRFPFNLLPTFGGKPFSFIEFDFISGYLAEGFAVVIYDVRGSGASMGSNQYPWHDRELLDYDEVLRWVKAQEWCSGQIGLWGTSYCACNAYIASLRQATAPIQDTTDIKYDTSGINAVAGLFGFWDIYKDIGYIGGIRLAIFLKGWQRFLQRLDLHEFWRESILILLLIENVSPVVEEGGASARRSRFNARLFHKSNWQPTGDVVDCIDDKGPQSGLIADAVSPMGIFEAALSTNRIDVSLMPAFLHASGWFDPSCVSAIKYFSWLLKHFPSTPQRLVLGAWTHAGTQHVRSTEKYPITYAPFSFASLLRCFMAQHVRKTPLTPDAVAIDVHSAVSLTLPSETAPSLILAELSDKRPVAYFVMQAEHWRVSCSYPPPSADLSLVLSGEQQPLNISSHSREGRGRARPHLTLVEEASLRVSEAPSASHVVTLQVDPGRDRGCVGSSRWTAVAEVLSPVLADYDHQDLNHVRFTGTPLSADMEVSGIVRVALWLACSETLADVFVNLQCVDETGKGCYVTEGCLRLKHRKCHNADQVRNQGAQPERSFKREDILDPPAAPEEIVVAMLPTSFLFKKGQCVRLSVYGADVAHFDAAAIHPYSVNIWTVRTSRDSVGTRTSRLLLPIPIYDA